MKLAEIVCLDAIIPQLESTDRDGVIYELIEALHKNKKIGKIDPKTLAKAVIKRENEASTGIGKGVAVPHVKHEAIIDPVAVLGCSSDGIDFVSLDKQPVYSVFCCSVRLQTRTNICRPWKPFLRIYKRMIFAVSSGRRRAAKM